jgi:hypothetical protein
MSKVFYFSKNLGSLFEGTTLVFRCIFIFDLVEHFVRVGGGFVWLNVIWGPWVFLNIAEGKIES